MVFLVVVVLIHWYRGTLLDQLSQTPFVFLLQFLAVTCQLIEYVSWCEMNSGFANEIDKFMFFFYRQMLVCQHGSFVRRGDRTHNLSPLPFSLNHPTHLISPLMGLCCFFFFLEEIWWEQYQCFLLNGKGRRGLNLICICVDFAVHKHVSSRIGCLGIRQCARIFMGPMQEARLRMG